MKITFKPIDWDAVSDTDNPLIIFCLLIAVVGLIVLAVCILGIFIAWSMPISWTVIRLAMVALAPSVVFYYFAPKIENMP
jgi:hypothetical protein